MANINPDSTMKYWYDSNSSIIIKSKPNAPIGKQNYWFNGKPQGFLTDSKGAGKPRSYGILIGF